MVRDPRMFEYEKYARFTALVHQGMEKECAAELERLGAVRCKVVYRAVRFGATLQTLYRITYCSRLTIRVLAPLLTFDCHSSRYLHRTATAIEWERVLTPAATFAISATVSDSKASHSLYAAQVLKDGIVDRFRSIHGSRPSVDTTAPDVRLNLRIHRNRAVIALDLSGESMHKRGYRAASVTAPLQEALAAALICKSEWDGTVPLWDPMCGSGTLLCEALMQYCRIPPLYLRKQFGFERVPGFDPALWDSVRREADAAIRELPPGVVRGSDCDPAAVRATRRNLAQLPFGERVEVRTQRFQDAPPFEGGTIVTNPPYGVRLGTRDETGLLYRELGNVLKKRCNKSSAIIYVGDPALSRCIGLKPTWRLPLDNGPIKGEVLRIDSYRVPFRLGSGEQPTPAGYRSASSTAL